MSAESALKLPLRSRLHRAMTRGTQGVFRLMLGPVLASMGRVIRDEVRGALWQDLAKSMRATDTLVLSLLRSGTGEGRFQAVAAGPDRILAAHPVVGFLYLDPADRTVTPRVVAGSYQPGVRITLERLVRAGDVVVEVGSRQGYHTLTCARLAGPGGRVIVLEPEASNLPVLLDNVRSHDLQRVVEVRPGIGIGQALTEAERKTRLIHVAAAVLTPALVDELARPLATSPQVKLIVEVAPATPPELFARLVAPGRRVWLIGDDGNLVETDPSAMKTVPGCRAEYLIAQELD